MEIMKLIIVQVSLSFCCFFLSCKASNLWNITRFFYAEDGDSSFSETLYQISASLPRKLSWLTASVLILRWGTALDTYPILVELKKLFKIKIDTYFITVTHGFCYWTATRIQHEKLKTTVSKPFNPCWAIKRRTVMTKWLHPHSVRSVNIKVIALG
jgi:hypothetical protein